MNALHVPPANIAPIRPFDEAAALEWLRGQPGGRTNLPAAELARRWGWRPQRVGRRLDAWAKAGLITARRGKTVTVANNAYATRPADGALVTVANDAAVARSLPTLPRVRGRVPVAPPVTPSSGIDVAAYAAAVALAGVAAVFSIRGMVVLFPGAPNTVIAMAGTMEAAKLVTAGWLAARWRVTAWVARLVLVALVAGLAVINATGVYAQLVAAHMGSRGEAASALQMQDAALASRIDVQAHVVADLDRRLNQVDTAIEEAAKRGKTSTALSAMEGQRRSRAALADERTHEAGTLAALQAERAGVAAKGRAIETEATPIRYVADLVGADTDSERAIRWLIALMVLTCDPLAIALTAAASSFKRRAA